MSTIDAVTYYDAVTITPSDTPPATQVVYAGLGCTTAGTATVVTARGNTVTISLTLGPPYPLAVVQVKATGTTAAGIVGMKQAPASGMF